MLNNNYIILDIETVVDKEAIEKSTVKQRGFDSYDDMVKYESKDLKHGKSYFPKPIFHKIVNIGLIFINKYSYNLKYIDFYDSEEEILLYKFWHVFNKCEMPVIVTYNGKYFDIPVISMRTEKHILTLVEDEILFKIIKRFHSEKDTWEKYGANYFNRNSKYHIDLSEQMGHPKPSLLETCSLHDISVKTQGSGCDISTMSIDEIRRYCKEDAIATAKKWCYHMLMKNIDNFTINEFQIIQDYLKQIEDV